LRFGWGTYDEMLEMRREIRAEREKTAFAQDEAKRQIQNNMAILGLSILIIGILGGGMYLIVLVV
jgi:pilus assembly protein TadC